MSDFDKQTEPTAFIASEISEKRRILADFESAWNPKTAEKYRTNL